ncbi:MAG: hydroxyethylthiazole kinase [Desulfobacter sp.]|nr:MAG: hydroxyethylthiazole kinase [Desulfobacter sp.]
MRINAAEICQDLDAVRQNSPLVHNITNFVVMNNTANALLALGASPVMAHAEEEVADMVSLASALVINIGTLSPKWIDAMFKAARAAKQKGIPIVLDPVGVGATPFRTATARNLVQEAAPEIIRGNGSEIMALSQAGISTKGVDSTSASNQALESARHLNREFNAVVCITGEVDFILNGSATIEVKNGHEMMPRVTGLGCTATAVCGAFADVNKNFEKAAAHAMAVMGIAGEMAAEKADGPGTLQLHFIDALYRICEQDIRDRLR